MFSNKISKLLLAALVSTSLFSCESLVDGFEEDPNNPADAPAELMLPGASMATMLVHEGEMARLAGMWSGYFTGVDRQYISLNQYSTTAGDYDSPWGNLYQGAFAQADIIRQKAEAVDNRALAGVAKVHIAHCIGTAAALFGDVPYTQANKFEEFPNPQFDGQAQVYASMQSLLDEAIADLESGKGTIDGDIFFGGNAAAWAKVAHTLKARYFMHTGDYASAYNEAQIGTTTPADSWMAPHGNDVGEVNTYWYFTVWERAGYMTADGAYLTQLLDPASPSYRGNTKTDEAARLGYYYINAQIYGAGYEPNFFNDYWWGAPRGMFGADSPFPLVSFEENHLILAEAGARTQGLSTGLQHLNEYRAYLSTGGYVNPDYGTPVMEAYTAEDFASGGVENADGLAADRALLREIMEERYVTFYGQLEGFNDLRRTADEPDIAVPVPPVTGSQIPQRFLYPQSEVNSNSNAPSPLPDLFAPTPINQ
jgi:hypothetical protein